MCGICLIPRLPCLTPGARPPSRRHKSQLVLVVGRKVLSHLHPDAQVKARLGLLRRARELASRPVSWSHALSGGCKLFVL